MTAPAFTLGERLQALGVRVLRRLPGAWLVKLSGEPPVRVDGQVLDPMLQLLRAVRRRRGFPGLAFPDIARARGRFERDMRLFGTHRTEVWGVHDLQVDGAAGPLAARHYAPFESGGEGARALLVWFHGGGFAMGGLDTHDEACRILCASGEVHVLSVAYRLAPEHPFPAAFDDARAAYRWALDNAARLSADASRVAVGGDSAGGNLAAAVAQAEAREGGRPPHAQVLVYPVLDSSRRRPSFDLFGEGYFLDERDRDAFARHYTGADARTDADPRVSPLLAPSVEGLPPALVVTAGFDILRDEGEEYARRLLDAGVKVMTLHFPSLAHGFLNLTDIVPRAHDATVHVGAGVGMLLS